MQARSEEREESIPLLEDYLGMDRRTLYILLALLAGAFVAATFVFIALFGFQSWRTNMARAGSQMVINFEAPVTAPAEALYYCPKCRAAAQPKWSLDGTPRCPICGGLLSEIGR